MEARLRNNELQINDSHSNKYALFLHNIPTSFLFSKFNPFCIDDSCQPKGYAEEKIKEASQDLKNFLLYINSVDLPDVGIGTSRLGTAFVDIPHPSGKIAYGDLVTNITIDENWFNYRMINYWMIAAHNPHEHNKTTAAEYSKNFFTSATLMILDNHNQKVQEFEFMDLHPLTIGSVPLKEENSEKLIVPVTWMHTGFVPSDRFVIRSL